MGGEGGAQQVGDFRQQLTAATFGDHGEGAQGERVACAGEGGQDFGLSVAADQWVGERGAQGRTGAHGLADGGRVVDHAAAREVTLDLFAGVRRRPGSR